MARWERFEGGVAPPRERRRDPGGGAGAAVRLSLPSRAHPHELERVAADLPDGARLGHAGRSRVGLGAALSLARQEARTRPGRGLRAVGAATRTRGRAGARARGGAGLSEGGRRSGGRPRLAGWSKWWGGVRL